MENSVNKIFVIEERFFIIKLFCEDGCLWEGKSVYIEINSG